MLDVSDGFIFCIACMLRLYLPKSCVFGRLWLKRAVAWWGLFVVLHCFGGFDVFTSNPSFCSFGPPLIL